MLPCKVDQERAAELVEAMGPIEAEQVQGGLWLYLGEHPQHGRILVVVTPLSDEALVVMSDPDSVGFSLS